MNWRYVRRIIIVAGLSVTAKAQELEVASIKPHAAHDACPSTRVLPGGTLVAGCYTLDFIIREALNIFPDHLSGGARWMKDEQWDIMAKATGVSGKSDSEVYRKMLWVIAVERFHLKLRTETREAKGLALVVAHNGKLGRAIQPNTGAPHTFDVKPGPVLLAKNVSMSEFATWLKMPAGLREVEDKTGLTGTYDFVLKWTPLNAEQITDRTISKDGPTIFTALREQLGLKLRGAKMPQHFYVIEYAQHPDPN